MTALVRIMVASALLVLLVWAFGSAEVGNRLRTADAAHIAIAVVALWAQTVLMALRWRLTARCLGLDFTTSWAVREYLVTQVVNVTVPGGVVGDGARAIRSQAGDRGLTRATQAVVLERAAGQVGLLLVGMVGLAWAILMPDGLDWPPGTVRALGLVGLTAIAVATAATLYLRGGRIAGLIAKCLPTARVRAVHAILSVLAALLNIMAFGACAWAVGVPLQPLAALALVPLILTAMVIPLGLAGWGWREGAAAALFPVAGATASAGVAAGIVFGITMMIAAAPGIPLLLWNDANRVRDMRQHGSG